MKKTYIPFITVLALFAAVFTSCDKDDNKDGNDNMKLVETISFDSGDYYRYEYDEQSRITKISYYESEGKEPSTETFTYNGDDLVKYVYVEKNYQSSIEYAKSGTGKIIGTRTDKDGFRGTITIELNNDGLPLKYQDGFSEINYQYQNGNMIGSSEWGKNASENIGSYKYDNNKSPFFHCQTPKWFMFCHFEYDGSPNNVIETTWTRSGKGRFTYSYDDSGFPVKCTETHKYDDVEEEADDVTVKEYKYK